jgi:hypothetical protein
LFHADFFVTTRDNKKISRASLSVVAGNAAAKGICAPDERVFFSSGETLMGEWGRRVTVFLFLHKGKFANQ